MQLFEEAKIGNIELKNRLVMAPMGTRYGAEYQTDERAITYYEERARGGFGLIIPGGYGISREFEPLEIALLNSREQVPLLGLLCDKVHYAGAKICIQINSGVGRNNWILEGGRPPKSASACDWFWNPGVKCIPLEKDEIKRLVDAHGVSARLAKQAGADMVLITAYGGYLMDQFLTPLWNTRTDEYGGSFENRMRFLKESYEAARAAVGPDFPLMIKYTPEHKLPGGRTLEDEGIKMALEMESWGVDALIVDLGSYDRWYLPIGTVYSPEGYHTYMAEAIKKAGVKIPLLASGNQKNPEVARRSIESGALDFVMIGHQSKADAYFPIKIRNGHLEDIRPCIGCNECLQGAKTNRIPGCAVNPRCYYEKDYLVVPAQEKKKVLVIGGGPAGMETALVAKERGHDVQIWEKSDRLGGNLNAAGAPTFKVPVHRFVEYYKTQIKKAGIPVFFNKDVTVEDIKNSGFDHIVCAVGSSPIMPPIPGINGSNVINSETALCGEPVTGKVVVIGGGLVGCEAAVHIAQTADDVTLIELLNDILLTADHAKNSDQELRYLVSEAKIDIRCGAKVVKIEPDKVIYEKDGVTVSVACDKVVIAVGYRANSEFVKTLKKEFNDQILDVIGDAIKAGKVYSAVHQGFHVACNI